MHLLTSLVVGVLVGWVASLLMSTSSREDLIRNVLAGAGGGCVGVWVMNMVMESPDQASVGFSVIVASSLGAAILLFLVRRFLRP